MIQTDLYKTFYFVATYKNISKAAKALYISQPAVSKSIKKLETLTKCILFNRSSKGVSLSTEGEILFGYVSKAFMHLDNGEKTIERIRNKEEGIVKISISNTLCKYFFLPYLQNFHNKYPAIKIQIVNRPSPSTLNLLDESLIDFGIISIPNDRSHYKFIEIMTVHDIFVTSNRLYKKNTKVAVEELTKYPLMMLEKGNQTRLYLDNFLSVNNINITPEIEIGSMDYLIEFAKIGIGTACVFKEFVLNELRDNLLHQIPIHPEPKPRKIGIVLKNNIQLSIAAKTFIEFIKNNS